MIIKPRVLMQKAEQGTGCKLPDDDMKVSKHVEV